MSLSRPVKFPLLKLPWLCIKCVFQNADEFVIIYFATISDRTRRIVKNSNCPIKEIDVAPNRSSICMGEGKYWYFTHDEYEYGVPLVLKRNYEPFLTNASFVPNIGSYLQSHTAGDKLDALKMGTEFMIDVFGCTIRQLLLERSTLSKLVRLGTMSVKKLVIGNGGPVHKNYLKYVLENIKVTDEWVFNARIPANFSCDPQVFKCRRLAFIYSADWVTLEILCQLNVPQLYFWGHRFSKEDIVSYVTHWFNSQNRILEYVEIRFNNQFTIYDFKINHLNPMPFDEKRRSRCPFVGGWKETDMSSGMDILREDGLLATLFVHLAYRTRTRGPTTNTIQSSLVFTRPLNTVIHSIKHIVLKRNSEPFLTNASFVPNIGSYLQSYTEGDTLDALETGIEFMIDVLGCTIRQLLLERTKLSELVRLGTMSVKKLFIGNGGPVHKNYLKYVLENIKVTDEWVFNARIPANFSCDPRIFKCRRLAFIYSADWVTLEILCQFDVPQLYFWGHRFSKEDIVSYVTHWFNSENRKLEYVEIRFNNRITIDDFNINHLNPISFCEKRRNRCPFVGGWEDTDISSGKDILREDGLLATLFVKPTFFSTEILFYIWHKRFPDDA